MTRWFPLFAVVSTLLVLPAALAAPPDADHAALSRAAEEVFGDLSSVCVEVRDLGRGVTHRIHPERCAVRLGPCSTFKIPNTLIGLETGAVTPETVFRWDGTKHAIESWNADQTLRDAMRHSCVWCYKELARRVGAERMQGWLDRLGYGNRDISGGIDRFWLGSTLTISADEQVEFLERLWAGKLPFRPEHVARTKELLVYLDGPGGTLSGKTGSCRAPGRTWGWYVGHLRSARGTFVFAANLEAPDGATGMVVRERLVRVFRQAGLLGEDVKETP